MLPLSPSLDHHKTTFAGSGNEGLQIGQNLGTVNTTFAISAGATVHMGRLSFLFHEIFLSFILICQSMTDEDNSCLADLLLTTPALRRLGSSGPRAACSSTHFAGFSTTLNSKDGVRATIANCFG
jgi:hypothetical protein